MSDLSSSPNHSNFYEWFNALSGLKTAHLTPLRSDQNQSTSEMEGQFMRQLLIARAKTIRPPFQLPSTDTLETIDRAWTNIKTLAQQEGLFGNQDTSSTPNHSAPDAFTERRSLTAIAANHPKYTLVASIAVLAFGIGVLLRIIPTMNPQDEVVMRGEEQAQRISTSNPVQLADQIERILQEHKYPYSRKNLTTPAGGIQNPSAATAKC